MTETIQCDGCGEQFPESEMTLENVPGTTLAWCDECSEKPYREQVL